MKTITKTLALHMAHSMGKAEGNVQVSSRLGKLSHTDMMGRRAIMVNSKRELTTGKFNVSTPYLSDFATAYIQDVAKILYNICHGVHVPVSMVNAFSEYALAVQAAEGLSVIRFFIDIDLDAPITEETRESCLQVVYETVCSQYTVERVKRRMVVLDKRLYNHCVAAAHLRRMAFSQDQITAALESLWTGPSDSSIHLVFPDLAMTTAECATVAAACSRAVAEQVPQLASHKNVIDPQVYDCQAHLRLVGSAKAAKPCDGKHPDHAVLLAAETAARQAAGQDVTPPPIEEGGDKVQCLASPACKVCQGDSQVWRGGLYLVSEVRGGKGKSFARRSKKMRSVIAPLRSASPQLSDLEKAVRYMYEFSTLRPSASLDSFDVNVFLNQRQFLKESVQFNNHRGSSSSEASAAATHPADRALTHAAIMAVHSRFRDKEMRTAAQALPVKSRADGTCATKGRVILGRDDPVTRRAQQLVRGVTVYVPDQGKNILSCQGTQMAPYTDIVIESVVRVPSHGGKKTRVWIKPAQSPGYQWCFGKLDNHKSVNIFFELDPKHELQLLQKCGCKCEKAHPKTGHPCKYRRACQVKRLTVEEWNYLSGVGGHVGGPGSSSDQDKRPAPSSSASASPLVKPKGNLAGPTRKKRDLLMDMVVSAFADAQSGDGSGRRAKKRRGGK